MFLCYSSSRTWLHNKNQNTKKSDQGSVAVIQEQIRAERSENGARFMNFVTSLEYRIEYC